MNALFLRLNLVMTNTIYHNTYYIISVKSLTNKNENTKRFASLYRVICVILKYNLRQAVK